MAASSDKYSPKWYQRSVSDVLNQGLQLAFDVCRMMVLGAWLGVMNCWKKPLALGLTVGVPLMVVVCHEVAALRTTAKQPAHFREIMDELSSIRIPTGKPVPNHANSKLIYLKYTQKDTWGLYLLDIVTGKSKQVSEAVRGKGESEYAIRNTVTLLDWSPDDKYFAYARNGNRQIVFFDGDSGAAIGQTNLSGSVTASTWLPSQTLLCATGARITEFSRSSQIWHSTAFFGTVPARGKTNNTAPPPIPVAEIKSLAAFDLNSAIWQQSNSIYVLQRGRTPALVWQATNCDLIEFSFSAPAKKLLLHCKDDRGEFMADFHPRMLAGKDTLTNVVRLDTTDYQPHQVALINNGKGCAYINHSDVSLSQLIVKITPSSPPVPLPWQDEIGDFYINGLKLYAICSSTNEPAGIWQYDMTSGALECLVSSIEQPFKYAATAPVVEGYVTNSEGEQLTYYLLQPANVPGNQKRPLVVGIMGIGELGYTWDRLAQTIASCGGYFLCMDRRHRTPSQWGEDALCAYDFLSEKYPIDAKNTYLLGISAGAYTAGDLLKSKPGMWKGAFLFSLHRFPTTNQMSAHSIALDVGELDIGKDKTNLLQSLDELAASGTRPILMMHPKIGHIDRSVRLDRERMERIAAFIRQP
jgi:hypothetical protein